MGRVIGGRIWAPTVGPHRDRREDDDHGVVVTGIGLITALGDTRERVWAAIQRGENGVGWLRGLRGIPDETMIAATVNSLGDLRGKLKVLELCERAAAEAWRDARLQSSELDLQRVGCALAGHMGDSQFLAERAGAASPRPEVPWWEQWLPNTACAHIADLYGLEGPRLAHSTACASGLISVLSAVRAIRDGQCDVALAGAGDAIDPLFAAGFQQMRVLAPPTEGFSACRPFDARRCGFVMGEGAAILVLERLEHARARRARIYAEILAGRVLAEAHHVTGLDAESETLERLIGEVLRQADLAACDIGYINAHGTGTAQNDLVEMRGIRRALGSATSDVYVSASKSMLGHMVNAAGSAELAVTLLAMRDGFAPPTINVSQPDPECEFDCLPRAGKTRRFQHALKLAVAFGGHLVAVALRRWNDPLTGFAYPSDVRRAA